MKRRQLIRALALAGAAPAWAAPAPPAPPPAATAKSMVHRLHPGESLAAVLELARSGDVIEIVSGVHRGQCGVVTQPMLTIRGIGPTRPVMVADGAEAERKAILVVRNATDVRIENLEFRGAQVQDLNGAGIRFESGFLSVHNCAFFDNEMGILTAHDPNAVMEVRRCEFGFTANTPAAKTSHAPPHLLYSGRIKKLLVAGCRFHHGLAGHLVKSRAQETDIRFNLLVDGPKGQSSYELNLPEGGRAWIVGNVISQSETSRNWAIVSYGEEGGSLAQHGLYMANNTLINLRGGGIFVRVSPERLAAGLDARFVNNLLIGPGDLQIGNLAWPADNRRATLSALQAPDYLDFHLSTRSGLRGTGVAPGTGGGRSLAPTEEFMLPQGTTPITAPAQWSPGAFQ